MENPLLSICCLTYNHVEYIKDALEGFLMQKTDFSIEIIVHDDASTDGTQAILLDFKCKYPDKFHLILQRENQYSKGIKPTFEYTVPMARGEYIALCEGDDYWIDPLKLQKQVDLLEKNPEYSLAVGGFKSLNVHTGEELKVVKRLKECDHVLGYSFDLVDTLDGWITKTLTAVLRKRDLNLDDFRDYKYSRDINLFYHLLKKGRGFYITDILGVYRIHEGGINSMKKGVVNHNNAYKVYRELFEKNGDYYTRVMSLRSALELFSYDLYKSYDENNFSKRIWTFMYAVRLVRNWSDLRMLIFSFLSRETKNSIKTRVQSFQR